MFFFLEKTIFHVWGPVASGVLFRLNELGLWPNDPVRGHKHIRGWPTKVEVEIEL